MTAPRLAILAATARPRRLGLTFAEVMFAVILLGIGFIMIAGIFPVAIQQTQTTVEETAGASLAQTAANLLSELADESRLPATGNVYMPLPTTLYNQVGTGMICQQDPRFAWTALYRRSSGDSFAQVIIITAQSRTRSAFGPEDVLLDNGEACLRPRVLEVTGLTNNDPNPDEITFKTGPNGEHNALAEGGVVIIASGTRAGRTYRLGAPRGPLQWRLLPGADLIDDAEELNGTEQAFILGKGYDWEAGGDPPPYAGDAMDIDVYTTFIRLK